MRRKPASTREKGVEHGSVKARRTWLDRKTAEEAELGHKRQPYCLIVGGGQAGIGLGARLKRLGVPTLIIDKHERPGDQWRKRYKSLCLHDPVWYDHMPYLPFPEHWPVFSPKDKIGDWLEMYTKVMELNYWPSTECKSASYDEKRKEWTVKVKRGGKDDHAQAEAARPRDRHVGRRRTFRSFPAPGASRACSIIRADIRAGKPTKARNASSSAPIIRRTTSAPISVEHGADVTMVQRSSTHVARSDTLMELGLGALYSEAAVKAGITTEKADMIFASIPYALLAGFQVPVYKEIAKRDAKFYQRLEKAGFMHDWGDDDSGLFMKYLRRGSGYYIDVGASDLIADRKIKLKSGVDVTEITAKGVRLSDGTELAADLIVYATGYGSMNGWATKLISPEVGGKGRQMLGPRLEHQEGSGALGGRASQHVEADTPGGALVPWRQSAPVAPLLEISRVADEGAARECADARLRPCRGSPRRMSGVRA